MAVTIPYPTLGTGVVADSTKIDDNLAAVVNKFGNIDNSDIKSGAGISIDKLSASYEYLPVSVRLTDGTAANEHLVPVYNDGKGDWSVVATQWATADTGTPAGTCTFKIEWGVYDGAATPGAFTVASTIDTIALAGTAVASQGVDSGPATSTLAFGGAGVYRALRFYISTVDADCGSPIYITLLLKRQIAT
jgi:hypothetical protein